MTSNKNQKNQNFPMMHGPMRGGFGKPKNFKKAWGNIFKKTNKYTLPIVFAVILAIVCTVITIVSPNLLEDITNELSNHIYNLDINFITKTCIILVCLYALSFVLNYLSTFIMATVTRKMAKDLRSEISRKINVLPLSYIDHTSHGDLLSRMTNDVDTIAQSMDQSVITLITSVLMLVSSLVIMFVKSWILALCAIGASIIGLVLVSLIMKFSQKQFIAQQQSLGEINGHIEEVYSSHAVVKAYNAEKQTAKKFNSINQDLYQSAWKSQFFSGLMMPIMTFIGNLGYVIVCVVGGALVLNGTLQLGAITAFLLYIRYFTQPLTQLAQVATQLQSAGAASERVFEFLDQKELEPETDKKQEIENFKGNVEFKNVCFGYTKDKQIIHDFSTSIKAGQKVAIVGPTGAGKTTLVNLLMRFYEVDSGDILIDGTSIKDLSRDAVHNLFSMVLQDTWIYNGTVRENIVYSKENVTDEEVVSAAKAVGLHHFIKTLPNGYDTILDENTSISAGQKQLLTIARAMVQNSPMLILDEATSSVDTRLEILIQQAMDALTQNRTSFVIAHRLSTIKNADKILVIKNGDIIEQGTHEELLAKNGFYAELYNSQFEE